MEQELKCQLGLPVEIMSREQHTNLKKQATSEAAPQ
jgi:hypothetical protein